MKNIKRISLNLNLDEELKNISMKENKYTIPVFIPHKGCKNECVFCNQKKISGVLKQPTEKEIIDIIDKNLEYIKDKIGNSKIEIAFFGGSFTGLDEVDQIKYLKIADKYIEKNIVQTIKISTRPDYISVHILKIMKKYNVDTIELGVQSLNDNVLKTSKRGHDKKDVIRASRLIRLFDIKLGHQIMIGLPKSTENIEINTIKESLKQRPSILRIYPVYVIEETELYDMYKSGEYIPLTLEEAIDRTYCVIKECQNTDVNIIRIGLQSTDIITSKNINIYGPISDNFGEYVLSKIVLNKLEDELKQLLSKNEITKDEMKYLDVFINKKYTSLVIGPKKANKIYLEEKYNLKLKVKGES